MRTTNRSYERVKRSGYCLFAQLEYLGQTLDESTYCIRIQTLYTVATVLDLLNKERERGNSRLVTWLDNFSASFPHEDLMLHRPAQLPHLHVIFSRHALLLLYAPIPNAGTMTLHDLTGKVVLVSGIGCVSEGYSALCSTGNVI